MRQKMWTKARYMSFIVSYNINCPISPLSTLPRHWGAEWGRGEFLFFYEVRIFLPLS